MTIELFNESVFETWDSFVLEQSVNGNFLQTRRFLGYHPEGRFEDCSLMYRDKGGNLRAVIPAAAVNANGSRHFVSHPGSTYGGIVLDKKTCLARKLQQIIEELVDCAMQMGFDQIDLRFPPSFMWLHDHSGLMDYLMQLNGFVSTAELTTYVDFNYYKESVVSNFTQGKRTNVNNAIKAGMHCRNLQSEDEIQSLYSLLCANLEKYGTRPVHTLEELQQLALYVLAGETELLGVFLDGELVAGGWVFEFNNLGVVHAQYLAADEKQARLSPATFLYYSIIQRARDAGYSKVSWGISTENAGSVLNWGLTQSKESYGSLHGVHRRYDLILQS